MRKPIFGVDTSVKGRASAADKLLGKTTKGTAEAPRPSTKIKPKGNPLKGNFGIQITKKIVRS